jgi:hypothetical protein
MTQLDQWLNSSEILMKNAFELTRQCIEFGETRLHEDFQILGKLMECKDLAQIADCHKAFTERASKQYRDQFNGVSRQIAGMMGAKPETGPIDVTPMPD